MSLRREGLFSYPIIGMQMHETNTTMSTMYPTYPTFVSVTAEFTDKLNLTYFIYIYICSFLWLLCGSDWRNKSGFASTDAKGWNPRVQACFSQYSGHLQAVIAVRSQYKDCMKTKDAEAFGFADLFGLIRRVHIRIIQNIFSCHIT